MCDCLCFKKDRPIPRGTKLDLDTINEMIRERTDQITNGIIDSSLNQAALPDFIERRLLNTIINLIFNIVIVTLLQPRDAKRAL